jgi:hypothetical protein
MSLQIDRCLFLLRWRKVKNIEEITLSLGFGSLLFSKSSIVLKSNCPSDCSEERNVKEKKKKKNTRDDTAKFDPNCEMQLLTLNNDRSKREEECDLASCFTSATNGKISIIEKRKRTDERRTSHLKDANQLQRRHQRMARETRFVLRLLQTSLLFLSPFVLHVFSHFFFSFRFFLSFRRTENDDSRSIRTRIVFAEGHIEMVE